MIANECVDHVTLLWEEYKLFGTNELRNKLVEQYLFIAKYHAQMIKAKLPASVQLDDLFCAAVFGLIHAVERFDLARGVKFETYCILRIRGAIFDELRKTDWVSRLKGGFALDQIPDTKTQDDFDSLASQIPFREMIACLSTTDKIIFKLYYCRNFTMEKIGKLLDMWESRISQRHAKALRRIKYRFFVSGICKKAKKK